MRNKFVLLEEATRVPMIMKFPSTSSSNNNYVNRVISEPVSHLDIFATIMDYMKAPLQYDTSDGKSLRRFIENQSFNEFHDERTVVVELDNRMIVRNGGNKYEGKLGGIPNFMVRHRNFKLIIPRMANSNVVDMMYDLLDDPYEMTNLIGPRRAQSASLDVIGKAEHLKCLLIEWMKR